MRVLKRTLLPLLLLIFILSSFSCVKRIPGESEPSFIEIAYKSLSISKETYDLSLNLAGTFVLQGKVTQAQANKVIEYANAYMLVHNDAVSALLKLKNSGLEVDKNTYIALALDLTVTLAKLVEYLDPIIKEAQ